MDNNKKSTLVEEENTKETISNENCEAEVEYKFVKETVIDKKSNFRKTVFRIIGNIFLILLVSAVTCVMFLKLTHINDDESASTSSEVRTSDQVDETTTPPQEVESTLSQEEIASLQIQNSVIILTGINISVESDDASENNIEMLQLLDENTTKFAGVVVSKTDGLLVLVPREYVANSRVIYAEVGECVDIPVEVIAQDEEFGIAMLKIDDDELDAETLDSIKEAGISSYSYPQMEAEVKYYGLMSGAGFSLLDAKVISQGEEVIVTDSIYNRYMIVTELAGIEEGFVFNQDGKLMAMSVQKEEDGRVTVIDLCSIKKTLNVLITYGEIVQMGIVGQKVNAEIEDIIGNDLPDGIYVTDIKSGSAAYRAGIMVGDIIYKVDTTTVESLKDIRKKIDTKKKGDVVNVHIYRNMAGVYNTYTLELELGVR